MKKNEIKKIFDLEWYYLGNDEQGREKYLLKDVLDEERIKKYSDDDFMINGIEVRHQDNIRNFDWNKSYIKNVILENLKKDLNIDCELDLLSKDEVNELDDKVKKCDDWYWTKTPDNGYTNGVWFVLTSGFVGTWNAYNTVGVRPVLYLKSDKQEKIEKIELENDRIIDIDKTEKHFITTNRKDRNIYIKKINEIIDKVNYLIEKSDKE